MHANTRIVLPKWIWDNAENKQEFKRNISQYMKRYPGYRVVEVRKYYCICERG